MLAKLVKGQWRSKEEKFQPDHPDSQLGCGGETTNEEVLCLLKSRFLGTQVSTTSSETYKAKHTRLGGGGGGGARISLVAAGTENKMRAGEGSRRGCLGEARLANGAWAAEGALHLGIRTLLLEKWREEREHVLEAAGHSTGQL